MGGAGGTLTRQKSAHSASRANNEYSHCEVAIEGIAVRRRYFLSVLVTAVIVLSGTFLALRPFASGLPFAIQVDSANSAKVARVPGVAIPQVLPPGTRIDLAAQPSATRVAIVRAIIYPNLPAGRVHIVMVRRGRAVIATPVITVQWTEGSRDLLDWAIRGSVLLLTTIALIALWLGRDRAAKGLALWGVAFLMAESAVAAPSDQATGLNLLLALTSLFLLARVGFYIMVESMVGGGAVIERANRVARELRLCARPRSRPIDRRPAGVHRHGLGGTAATRIRRRPDRLLLRPDGAVAGELS